MAQVFIETLLPDESFHMCGDCGIVFVVFIRLMIDVNKLAVSYPAYCPSCGKRFEPKTKKEEENEQIKRRTSRPRRQRSRGR